MKIFLLISLLQILFANETLQATTEKLKFSLYYDSLCSFCAEFISDQLEPALQKIGKYIELELVPYGFTKHVRKMNCVVATLITQFLLYLDNTTHNVLRGVALSCINKNPLLINGETTIPSWFRISSTQCQAFVEVSGNWVFQCNLPEECILDKMEICGITKSNNQTKTLEFVNCVERTAFNNYKELEKISECATKLGLTGKEILKCANGEEGYQLYNNLRKKQSELKPSIQYVPWLIFNDKRDEKLEDNARDNFLKTACDLFSEKPPGCF